MPTFEIRGVTLRIPEAQLSPGLRRALEKGHFEAQESMALLRHLKPGDRVLDIGAGAGLVSSLAAGVVGGGRVTSVEAAPDMLPVLRRNLNLNGAGEAEVIHGAVVAEASGPVRFAIGDGFWASRIGDAAGNEAGDEAGDGGRMVEVPALRFRDLVERVRPSVVVMDIEGGELEICQLDWPGCVRLLIMEIHTGRYPPEAVKAMFDGLSRAGFTYMPWGTRGEVVVQQRLPGAGA